VEQSCPPTTTVTVNETVYWSCTATLYWNPSVEPENFTVQELAVVPFQGVLFNITGYVTMDCPVVNVTGHETAGMTYSLWIFAIPMNCQYVHPTVLSQDQNFGATWNGGSSIQVLVREG
jgi:hypothetical protein